MSPLRVWKGVSWVRGVGSMIPWWDEGRDEGVVIFFLVGGM